MFNWIERHPFIIFTGIIGLYGLYLLVVPCCFDEQMANDCTKKSDVVVSSSGRTSGLIPWDKSGVFGDSFGALTCLFSALTFWAMLYALIYQRQQTKDVRDSIAREHLPLILVMPESGSIEFRFGKTTSCLILVVRIKVNEENSSDNAALGIVHHSRIELPPFGDIQFTRGVDTSNFMRAHKGFARHEEFTITDGTEISRFLSTLIAHEQKQRPELVLNRVYKCFLEACAEMSQSYRVKLLHHKEDEPKLKALIQLLEAGESITEEDLQTLLGDVLSFELECKPIHERMMRRCCSVKRYNQFIKDHKVQ